MNDKPRSNAELARALGVSPALVSKHAARGMPTHSVKAALAWRAATLKRHQTKQTRAGGNSGRRFAAGPAPVVDTRLDLEADEEELDAFLARYIESHAVLPVDEGLALVTTLGALAARMLKEGRFAEIEPAMRAALRAIPYERRGDVLIHVGDDARFVGCALARGSCQVPLAVWDELLRDVPRRVEGEPDEAPTADYSDADFARDLYRIAAGEMVI